MNGGGIRPSAGVVLPLLPPALLHYTINRRKLQAVRQKICAKKVEMLGGVPCAAPARPAVHVPGGELAFFAARQPCLSLAFLPPIPPPPFPGGEGGDQDYFMQGASPLASPRLNPGGTGSAGVSGARGSAQGAGCRFALPSMSPAGSLPSLPLANRAFRLLSCPLSPQPPSPAGKGETQSLFRRGLRPRHPCI